MSPYGKIVVIKSLALSKLSHIALVVPSLAKNHLKKLEKILFSFLWSNKTAKISKIDSYKPIKKGGLGMVEVFNFWRALKCSWTRRILHSNAFWPKILDKTLEPHNLTVNDLIFSGPSKLNSLSKEIKNKFWQNFFISIDELQREANYAVPEIFYLFSVFDNPLFKSGRNCLQKLDFGNPRHRITQVADFYHINGQLATLASINAKFETNMSIIQLDRIHSAIKAGRTNLNLNLGICNWHQEPRQSLLIQIACKQLKGWRAFYNILEPDLMIGGIHQNMKQNGTFCWELSYLSGFGTMLGNCILASKTITPLNGYNALF